MSCHLPLLINHLRQTAQVGIKVLRLVVNLRHLRQRTERQRTGTTEIKKRGQQPYPFQVFAFIGLAGSTESDQGTEGCHLWRINIA